MSREISRQLTFRAVQMIVVILDGHDGQLDNLLVGLRRGRALVSCRAEAIGKLGNLGQDCNLRADRHLATVPWGCGFHR